MKILHLQGFKPYFLFALALLMLISYSCVNEDMERDYYQIKIFSLKDSIQEVRMDKYLKEAYIPALHRAGIDKVGVFKPVEEDTIAGNVIVVWTPLASLQQIEDISRTLNADQIYQSTGEDYINAVYDDPPYDRIESILLKAFSHMPAFKVPSFSTSPAERIYELRSYEGATEKIYRRKVEMFNEGGEIELFKKLEFNAVFYGEVLSGSTMPNLMYMTTFSDINSRTEHWNAFRNHPDWKVLSGLDKYKNTVSRITIYLLHPTDYSDF